MLNKILCVCAALQEPKHVRRWDQEDFHRAVSETRNPVDVIIENMGITKPFLARILSTECEVEVHQLDGKELFLVMVPKDKRGRPISFSKTNPL